MTEERLVVVANRVPPPLSEETARRSVGGLVAALAPALREAGGLWLGWSGQSGDGGAAPRQRKEEGLTVVTIDLSAEDVHEYYEGFCNQALWPVMHGFPEQMAFRPSQWAAYRRVNERFAETLRPLLRAGDLVWVHDYHLLLLGDLLRARGWQGRVGYFHHIPIPSRADWQLLPSADNLLAALGAYDLVGVQTEGDAARVREVTGRGWRVRCGAYPIGIDPALWQTAADRHPANPFEPEARGRRVLFGVDRLDYTKGIPARLSAFARALEREPVWRNRALLVQWAAPSRETIPTYRAELEAVEQWVRRITAGCVPAEAPVRFEHAVRPTEAVAAAYREAAVCLVTSLADGMNLVAKEFVAVQRHDDPGVLVLSRRCGAAEQLPEAILVDPLDREALATALLQALTMPREERVVRWEALHAVMARETVHAWRERFLRDLKAA